jgi:hypothetical protein
MKNTEPEDDHFEFTFRELFSEDETREFYQPEFQLPTRRIAFWSAGLSFLLAGALVISWLNEQHRPVPRPKQVQRLSKNSLLRPAKRSKTDTTMYLRQHGR